MPEKLKPSDRLLSPDPRSVLVGIDRDTGEQRAITLEDMHRNAARIQLNKTVPQDIRDHFTTALNLGVYSWFVYRFTMVSQQQAYATLEWALRERLGTSAKRRRATFAELLTEAVDTEVLRGRAFRHWVVIGGDPNDDEAADAWLREMIDVIRNFRNDLAHGSFTLAPMHWMILNIVADAVNQLYPEPLTDGPTLDG
jgi:hypothetical protein